MRRDHERRRGTQRALVDIAIGDADLRPGMSRQRAADAFFLHVNSSYQLATEGLGWSDADWQRWLIATLAREFYGDASSDR